MCTYFRQNPVLTEMDKRNKGLKNEQKPVIIVGNCLRKKDSIFSVYATNYCSYFRSVILYPIAKPKPEKKEERKGKSFFQKISDFFKRIFKK